MPDLQEGESIEVQGSGSRPYVLKNVGGVYSCTCPAWRNQSQPIERRTCKHLRKLRGDAAEATRLGDALSSPPPRQAGEGEDRQGPPVLLAESWDNEADLAGWWMSEKLDGVRAYWDGRRFLSRNGNLFLAPDWFLAGLPPVPLDGELWIARKAFQRTSGIVRRQDRPPEWRQVRFVVFDAPALDTAFEARLRFLDELLGRDRPEHVDLLPQQPCRGLDHLRQELERIDTLGGEGLMLRQPGSRYVAGRSSTLLKVKRFLDAEARVIGHEPGQGRHKGRLGALLAQLADGTVFAVGTGLSDAQRSAPPAIGSVITFRYQELSDRGVPRFPSFVGVRPDAAPTPLPAVPAVTLRPPAVQVTAPPAEATTRRFRYGIGDAERLWEVTLRGPEVEIRYGSPAAPKSKQERHASAAAAQRAVEELIADKRDDGFVEQGADDAPAAPAVKAPSPPVASPAPAAGVRHFEYVEGTSSKFWEVWTEGATLKTRYGRIGSQGVTTLKGYADATAARNAAEKLVREKTGKGYVER